MVFSTLLPVVGALALGVASSHAAPFFPSLPRDSLPCYIHAAPDNKTLIPYDCLPSQLDKLDRRSLTASGTAPLIAPTVGAPTIATARTAPQAFNFVFSPACVSGETRTDYCQQAQNAFVQAGNLMSAVFDIKATINVRVNIRPFCAGGNCPPGEAADSLANAGPELSIPLQGDDGVARYYPAALVKQFGLPNIGFTDFDVQVNVNAQPSSVGQRLYFMGDPLPGPDEQIHDFLSTILHELLHGLGFLSLFDYAELGGNKIYRPSIGLLSDGRANAFIEGIFDRYLVRQDTMTRTSVATNTGNTLLFPGDTTQDGEDQSYIQNNPAVYQQFVQLGALATTARSISFNANNVGVTRFLETSLSPFQPGSSGSHLDRTTYENSADFLMTFENNPSGTLAQQVARYNNLLPANQMNDPTALANVDLRRALGPGILSIMQSLGWIIRMDSATPPPAPTSVTPTLPDSSNNPEIVSVPVGASQRAGQRARRAVHKRDDSAW